MVAISRAGSSIFVKTESLSMLGLQKKNRVRRSKNIKGTSSETHWHHLLFFSIFGIFLVFASLVVCWSPTKPVSKCGFPFQSPKKQKKNNLQFSFQHLKGGVFINSHGGRSPRICERFDHSDPFDLRVSRISGVTGPTHRAEGVLEAEGFEGLWASKSVGFLGYLWGEHGFNT